MNATTFGCFAFGVAMCLLPVVSWQLRYIYRLEKRIETLEQDIDATEFWRINIDNQWEAISRQKEPRMTRSKQLQELNVVYGYHPASDEQKKLYAIIEERTKELAILYCDACEEGSEELARALEYLRIAKLMVIAGIACDRIRRETEAGVVESDPAPLRLEDVIDKQGQRLSDAEVDEAAAMLRRKP